ncbi:hypothetical protein KEJ50_04320 [Candidatus Bathyarchaeota archaeon]|nr:hypothetical protein [Candidatus Bathyarchaeota archaeon]
MKIKFGFHQVFNKKFVISAFLMTFFSLIDSYYTMISISRYGVFGEKNPFALFLFKLGLSKLWLIINVITGFLIVTLFFLLINYLNGRVKYFLLSFFSVLLTIKILISIRYFCIFHFNFNIEPALIGLGILIFILITLALTPKQETAKFFKEVLNDLNDLIFPSPKLKVELKMKPIVKQSKWKKSKLKNKKLWILLATIILCPFITLNLLQLLWKISKIQEVPKWLRSLGIVTQMQGILYLISFLLILIMLAVMIYSITAVFEIFTHHNKTEYVKKVFHQIYNLKCKVYGKLTCIHKGE